MSWQVYDMQTGRVVGVYQSLASAHRRADKLDQHYGAIRFGVQRAHLMREQETETVNEQEDNQ